jgi:hypothetical protein
MPMVAHPTRELVRSVGVIASRDVEVLDARELEAVIDAAGDARPCVNADPEAYFPELGTHPAKIDGSRYREEQDRARTLCAGCPVIGECLELALQTPSARRYGIWGGTSEWERLAIRAARLQAAQAVTAHRPAYIAAVA